MSKVNDPRLKLGKAIRARRIELGMSQEELASRADIHVTYLSSVECGHRNVALLNIIEIAQSLGLLGSELFLKADI